MSESGDFTIGSDVWCSDGACGKLTRVVIDPVARALTHLVVGPRHGRGMGHLVPVGLVESAAAEVRLRCTTSEFEALEEAEETDDRVPMGEVEVRRGEHVHATDGAIGRVQGLVVDPGDHQVTHVLLDEGHLWGKKRVAIPISAVAGISEGVRLSLTKDEVGNLPPIDLDPEK